MKPKPDLSSWNEYIADDVYPGPIPCDVEIEYMQCIYAIAKMIKHEVGPSTLELKNMHYTVRTFWKIKNDTEPQDDSQKA